MQQTETQIPHIRETIKRDYHAMIWNMRMLTQAQMQERYDMFCASLDAVSDDAVIREWGIYPEDCWKPFDGSAWEQVAQSLEEEVERSDWVERNPFLLHLRSVCYGIGVLAFVLVSALIICEILRRL